MPAVPNGLQLCQHQNRLSKKHPSDEASGLLQAVTRAENMTHTYVCLVSVYAIGNGD